jgi:hypothetical protein
MSSVRKVTGLAPARRAPYDTARAGRWSAAGSGDHELQFGAEQADAGAAGLLDMRQVDGQAGIDQQFDRFGRLW